MQVRRADRGCAFFKVSGSMLVSTSGAKCRTSNNSHTLDCIHLMVALADTILIDDGVGGSSVLLFLNLFNCRIFETRVTKICKAGWLLFCH